VEIQRLNLDKCLVQNSLRSHLPTETKSEDSATDVHSAYGAVPRRGGGNLRALDSGGLISVRPQKADYSTPNRSLQKEANPAPSAGSKVSFQEALNP